MTDKELEDFIHHGETGFLAFAMIFGDGWAKQAIDIAKELRARLAQPENKFNPDWDAMAVMVEEQQRMAKRVEELEAQLAQPEPEPVAIKFQIYKQTPSRGRELEPINSALLPWVYDQDPSSGNTASMWVTPVATLPPQREWQGITDENIFAVLENLQEMYNRPPTTDSRVIFARAIEAKLKEKNT